MAICTSGHYVSSRGRPVDIATLVFDCIEKAVLYRPRDTFSPIGAPRGRGIIEVREETAFQACQRIRSDFPDAPVAVLNFASASKPGGGFLNGRQAQEEALCRASALYVSISQFREMYDHALTHPNPLYSDYMIYSPKVPFFRDDSQTLIDRPFCVSVITAAAPNAQECVLPAFRRALHGTLKNRMRKIMQVAIAHGDRILVLGAFGCGVFKNDPTDVATIERELLVDEGLLSQFDFVLNPVTGRQNLTAFRAVFDR